MTTPTCSYSVKGQIISNFWYCKAIFFITDSYIIANRVLVLDLYTIYMDKQRLRRVLGKFTKQELPGVVKQLGLESSLGSMKGRNKRELVSMLVDSCTQAEVSNSEVLQLEMNCELFLVELDIILKVDRHLYNFHTSCNTQFVCTVKYEFAQLTRLCTKSAGQA